MISLDLLLKHMQWANKEIYTEVSKLDSEVLDYYVIDPEWKIKQLNQRCWKTGSKNLSKNSKTVVTTGLVFKATRAVTFIPGKSLDIFKRLGRSAVIN